MSRLIVAVMLAAGCGRVGFDGSADASTDVALPGGASIDIDTTTSLGSLAFTRSTPATYVDSTGTVRIAAADEPRFEFDPTTRAPRGLLLETSSRNLVTRASQFDDDGAWFRNGNFFVTGDATIAPDGTSGADLLDDTDMAGDGRRGQGIPVTSAALPWVYSAFVRPGTLLRMTFAAELLLGTTQIQTHMNLDLVTGLRMIAGIGVVSHGVERFNDGWLRAWIRIDNNDTGNVDAVLSLWNDRTAPADTGTFYAWGAQLEQAVAPSSYIPTIDTDVPRAADVVTGTLEDTGAGTLLVRATPGFDRDAPRVVACVGGSSGACIRRDGVTDRAQLGLGTQTIEGTPWPEATERTLVMTWDASQVRLREGGTTVTLSGTPASASALVLGGLDGHVQRIVYWPRVLDDAEIAALAP